jgi:hypothetical protein
MHKVRLTRNKKEPGLMVNVYNPSYSGDGGEKGTVFTNMNQVRGSHPALCLTNAGKNEFRFSPLSSLPREQAAVSDGVSVL